MMSIARSDYIEKILPYMNKPVIKVLTGMRRVGKSTILKMLIDTLLQQGVTDKRIVYINMESIRWDFIKDYKDLHAYVSDYFKDVSAESKYVFIDEVQEIKEWERAVNSMLSESYADIILTGSNAHLLASDLATFLSGRYIEFPVYPLTFKEFLNFRAGKDQSQREAFKLFLWYGGLPGIHNFELTDDYAFQYLQSVYNTLVLKDVVSRHVIKDPAQLDLIIRFIFDNCGNITTSKRISDYLKNQKISVSVDKVINYLKYLESAFLIKKTMRYDLKGLRHLELYEKYYTGDIGLRHGFIGYRDNDVSGIIENIVYLELLQRGYSVQIGKFDDLEIDFIAQRNNEKMFVQVAYSLSDEKTINREFYPLEMIKDNYPKIVLTMDEFQSIDRGGIKSKYLLDFLVES
ncbi:MAG TPA: ATP-binding protein [Treponemataceae bacterium]|nr:ATP-binding protein [Treponemataceae bacterium]